MYPILGYFGDAAIRTYVVINAIGVLTGFFVLYLNLRPLPEEKKKSIFLFAAFIFIPFVIGARLGNITESLLNNTPICSSFLFIIGPSSLWWGLWAATVCAFPVAKALKCDVWETADYFALSISIGGVFARLACLSAGCCFGKPCGETNAGLLFTSISPAGIKFPDILLYPSQLYESLAWLAIFISLNLIKRTQTFRGELIVSLAALYSMFRFFIEFSRFHENETILSIAQIWSILLFIISMCVYFIFKIYGINRLKNS
jgi:phosphatidylglycerol---prolipoprotein diacylglyceryl transferase